MKAEKTILRRWTLRMAFLGDDKALFMNLILALVSILLLVNLIKKGKSPKKKRLIDFFLLFY